MTIGKPCIICGRELRPATPGGWEYWQPSEGGEVNFIFSYGSCKYDLCLDGTIFRGVICDDCAEECIERMERIP